MATRWVISCDRCGRDGPSDERRDEVRRLARAEGWHLRQPQWKQMSDICPSCYAPRAARSSRPASLGRNG